MIYIFNILINKVSIFKKNEDLNHKVNKGTIYRGPTKLSRFNWIFNLLPLLTLTLFVTGAMALLQSILPLDLANGGIIRPPLREQRVAILVAYKLILISVFQWPVAYIIRNKSSPFKFRLCLEFLLTGFIFLSLSNLLIDGYLLILLAFIPITISLCIFLPSASDAIIKCSSIKKRGAAIALYSQCFGISALSIPWIAGKLIDTYNTAFPVWLIFSLICIILIPICKRIQ